MILQLVFVFIPPKNAGTFIITVRFWTLHHHVFCLWFHAWNLLYVMSRQRHITDVSIVLRWTLHHHVFCLWFHAWNLLYVMSWQRHITDVSIVLRIVIQNNKPQFAWYGFLYQMTWKQTVETLYHLYVIINCIPISKCVTMRQRVKHYFLLRHDSVKWSKALFLYF